MLLHLQGRDLCFPRYGCPFLLINSSISINIKPPHPHWFYFIVLFPVPRSLYTVPSQGGERIMKTRYADYPWHATPNTTRSRRFPVLLDLNKFLNPLISWSLSAVTFDWNISLGAVRFDWTVSQSTHQQLIAPCCFNWAHSVWLHSIISCYRIIAIYS